VSSPVVSVAVSSPQKASVAVSSPVVSVAPSPLVSVAVASPQIVSVAV
jgi:hypothetical protein